MCFVHMVPSQVDTDKKICFVKSLRVSNIFLLSINFNEHLRETPSIGSFIFIKNGTFYIFIFLSFEHVQNLAVYLESFQT